MSHPSVHSTPNRALSLSEMLADPIVRAVMARDGVTEQDVEGLIGAVRDRRAAWQMEEHETGHHEIGTLAFEG
jgi:hypothetical protein